MKANDFLGGYPYLMMMQRWARPLWYLSPIFWLIAIVPDADPNRQATLIVVVVVCQWWRHRNGMMVTGSVSKQSKERLKGVKKEGPVPLLFLPGDLWDKIQWKKSVSNGNAIELQWLVKVSSWAKRIMKRSAELVADLKFWSQDSTKCEALILPQVQERGTDRRSSYSTNPKEWSKE